MMSIFAAKLYLDSVIMLASTGAQYEDSSDRFHKYVWILLLFIATKVYDSES